MARKQTPKGNPPNNGPTGGSSGTSRKQQAREKAAAVQAEARRRERRRNLLIQGSIVVVVAVILVGITVMVLQAREDATAREQPPAGFDDNGGIFLGAASAAVTVTLVEDLACPACQAFEAQNKELLDSYAASDSDVRLEYRPIAFLDRVSTDEYSSRALNAAACVVADDPANWAGIHQLAYANQPAEGGPGLSDDQLIDLAVQAGADEAAVTTCIEDRTYDDWVEATTSRTTSESFFSGTPTVLVNGTKVEDVSAAGIQAAVEAAQNK